MDHEQLEQLKTYQTDLEVRLMALRTYLSVESRRCGIQFDPQLCSKTDAIERPSMPTPSTDHDNKVSSDKKDVLMLQKMHSESSISTRKSGFERRCLAAADPQFKTLLESAHETTLFAIDYLHRCKIIIQKLHNDCNEVAVTNANTLDRLREIDYLVKNLTRLLLPGTGEMTDGESQRADESVEKLQQGITHPASPESSEEPNEGRSLTGSLGKRNSGEPRLSLPRCKPKPGNGQTITLDKPHLVEEPDEVPRISEVHVYLPSATPGDPELFTEEAGLTSEHPAPEVVPTQRSTRDEIAGVCDSIRHHIGALENFHATFDLEQKACLRIVENITRQIENHRTALSKVTKTKVPAIYRESRKTVPLVKSVDTVRHTGLGLLRTKLQSLASELHCYVTPESEILSSWTDEEVYGALNTPRMIPPGCCFEEKDQNTGPALTNTAHRLTKIIDAERERCLKIVEELHKVVRTRRELIQKPENGRLGNGRHPNARGGMPGRKMATVRDVNRDLRRKLEQLNQETKLCLRLEFDRSNGIRREMTRRSQEYEATVKDLRVEVKRMKRNAMEGERRRKLLEFDHASSYGIRFGNIGTPRINCTGTSQLQSGRYNWLPEIQVVAQRVEPKIRGKCSFPEIRSDRRHQCIGLSEPQCVLSDSNGGKSDHESPANKEAVELQHSPNGEILAVFGFAADGIKQEPKIQRQNESAQKQKESAQKQKESAQIQKESAQKQKQSAQKKKQSAEILTKSSFVLHEDRFKSKPTPHHSSDKHVSH